ncbi:hypothetical protein [Paraburkholderia diazotrophica]|uniref:Uncharacterized protein n=1 Tax=Paraburkholderia diazotrophica TaxID=667676 RepID=A0A1H6WTM5_9BURK|nr:hypothetical protein [Paraburkholderia diazotrophica]SEJ18604.1 hypothetical protein SAMN05192539_1007195 [Paraburkholderia diazotrophica]
MKGQTHSARWADVDTAEKQMLTRMATSRTQLLAAQAATRSGEQTRKPSLFFRAQELVATAPNITLLTVIVASAAIIGPRKMTSLVVRNGLAGWIGKSVRRLAER